jgi:hypothetical protein
LLFRQPRSLFLQVKITNLRSASGYFADMQDVFLASQVNVVLAAIIPLFIISCTVFVLV